MLEVGFLTHSLEHYTRCKHYRISRIYSFTFPYVRSRYGYQVRNLNTLGFDLLDLHPFGADFVHLQGNYPIAGTEPPLSTLFWNAIVRCSPQLACASG